MPLYKFEVDRDGGEEHELLNDSAAWSEVVTLCGELLKDIDGKMPPHTEMRVSVLEGERKVAQIRIVADKCGA